MEEPQQVQADEEYERVWERVAAIDVAKASGVVCTRVPDEDRPGRRKMHVWTVTATRRAIIELADHLRCQQIEIVSLEDPSKEPGPKWQGEAKDQQFVVEGGQGLQTGDKVKLEVEGD